MIHELAETCNGPDEHIPEIYIRPEASSEEVISNYHGEAIPIIDLNKLLSPQSSEEECVKLRSACQYWGFFLLINHGVQDEVIANLKRDIVDFFSQPLDTKKEYTQLPNSLEGYGQGFVFSEDQKLDWADMLYLQVHPSDSRDLRFWPTSPASFRQSIDAYSSETKSLALCLLEFMAKAVGAKPESLLGIFEEQPRGLRMTYYPPCRQSDKVMGLSPHSDVVGLTLLLQINDVQGLQIKKDGRWLSVDSPNGALIVNIGDTLEILSNGKFRSVEHRAVINPNKERISASLFHYPCENMVIRPLPEFVKDGKPRTTASQEKKIKENTRCRNLGIAMAGARSVGSLPVPNVQALAETCNGPDEHIPERYIRPEASSEEVINNYQGSMAIPIIDLNKLLSPQSSEEEVVKLRSACQYWGFFQLINHGVPDEVIANLKRDIVDFFSQPLDTKKEYTQLPNSLEGYGQSFVFSEDQKLEWADMLYLHVHPSDSRDLRFWPTSPASFRHLSLLNRRCLKVGNPLMHTHQRLKAWHLCLFEFMAKAVGAEPESLLGLFEEQPRGLRMAYYPPCRQADKVMGLSPHSDAGGLTLLLQINDMQGLQIKKDGKWLSIDAPNGALIANVGDTLEILSNGTFRSVEHRVMVNPNKERISAALFHYPCENMVISPLPEFVKNGKVKYRSISYLDFMKQIFTQQLDGKSRVETLKLDQ
uniref:Fe2OG dioxygenase domain-containing protein n=1 Tax=Oryza punctata TaxID=4537 RepID=A0A0E0MAM9_ORYPU